MQTFLPYPDFTQSAQCLDRQRLGKQRVETLQILKALTDPAYGWQNHPATHMWRGYTPALADYGLAICAEWRARGYRDSCALQLVPFTVENPSLPSWIGNPDLHASHRSNLLRKFPEHYAQFGWTEGPDLPYIWPVG